MSLVIVVVDQANTCTTLLSAPTHLQPPLRLKNAIVLTPTLRPMTPEGVMAMQVGRAKPFVPRGSASTAAFAAKPRAPKELAQREAIMHVDRVRE